MQTLLKITVVAAGLAVAFLSCKKNKTEAFTPTDVTGTTVVSGHVDKKVITADGSGGWTSSANGGSAAQSVNISITVAKSSLYPNSTAQGADVYRGSTDANGNYSIPVRSNAGGVTAMMSIEGFTGTLDTLINGGVKTGQTAVFQGTTATLTLYMGQNVQFNYSFDQQGTGGNPNSLQTGTAIVTGSVSVSLLKVPIVGGTVQPASPVNVTVPEGHKVYLKINKDPITMATKVYETTTDANGYYTFNVITVPAGTSGFPQSATVSVNDFATSRDTILPNNTLKPGLQGVFSAVNASVSGGVYNNSIKNAVYLRYSVFTPN